MNNYIEKLREKSKSLPSKAGCYLMLDRFGRVIYVGKAKSLKSRVSSYFQNSVKSPKTEILVSHIVDFDFFTVETESEALILENNLIKDHRPKYNILMKDDKSYPYVVINKSEPFARLEYLRKVKREDEKLVFGPFVHGSNISEVLRILTKTFLLRDCSLKEMNSRKEPCLLFQIHQCSAPCVGKITQEEYDELLDIIISFFNGKPRKTIAYLESEMNKSAENEKFERAIIIRDSLETLNQFLDYTTKSNVEIDQKDLDVIAYYVGEVEVELSFYIVRNGMLLGNKNFHFLVQDCLDEVEEEVKNFVMQYYYDSKDLLPKSIVHSFKQKNSLEEVLKKLGVCNFYSSKGKYSPLYEMTYNQAKEFQRVRVFNQDSVYIGLNKLKSLLSLKERPKKLECYDIAIFQGASPTASQIVFVEGKPEKKEYRHYHLEERPEGNNDYAMMKEVITRRIEKEDLPDVFIVDGGKGQVNSFLSVLKEKGIEVPVVGIAKEKKLKGKKTEERLIIPGRLNAFSLTKEKSLLKIIVQMRDEAHRFSRRLHHHIEKRKLINSWLDQIEGIGPKTREKILSKLNVSKEELVNFSLNELKSKFDISEKIGIKILEFLKK